MQPDLATMIKRLGALRARVEGGEEAPLAQIEEALTDGYAEALAADAWSMSTEDRLQELITNASIPVRGRELRALATEHQCFQRDLIALRRELAALRRDRDGRRAHSSVRSV